MAKWNSIAAAVAELGEATAVNWLNQFAANKAYRKAYTKVRNEAFKAVQADPKYKQLLAEHRAAAAAPAVVPVLRKKA